MFKKKHFISLFAIMMTFTSCLTACKEDNMGSTSSSVSKTNSLESSSSNNGNETKGRKVSEAEWKESLNDIFSNWLDKYVGYFTIETSNNESSYFINSIIDGAHNKMFLEEHETSNNYDAKSKTYRELNPDTLSMTEYFCGRDGDFNTQEQWIISRENTYSTEKEMKEDFLHDCYAFTFYEMMETFRTTQYDVGNGENKLIIDAYSSFAYDETTGIYSAFLNQNLMISFIGEKVYINIDALENNKYTSYFVSATNHELILSDEDKIGITNAIKREDFESKN